MPPSRSIGKKNHDLPPTARSKRLSPSVTMSSPAASWALTTHATASRYCSRNSESPSAALNDRPRRLSVNQSGRGYEPGIAGGSTRSRGTVSIDSSAGSGGPGGGRRLHPEEPEAVVPGDVVVLIRREAEHAQRAIRGPLRRHVGIVRPDEDLARSDEVDQVAQRAPIEQQRVVVEPARVLRRRARQASRHRGAAARSGRLLVPGAAPVMAVAGEHQRERPAAVAERDAQARTLLRRAAVDQGGDREPGVGGIADRI